MQPARRLVLQLVFDELQTEEAQEEGRADQGNDAAHEPNTEQGEEIGHGHHPSWWE